MSPTSARWARWPGTSPSLPAPRAPRFRADVNGYFAEMGRIAVDLSRNAKDVVLSGNPRPASQLAYGDAMDELHGLLFSVVLDKRCPHTVPVAVDTTLLSRHYKRFADHSVGPRILFQTTGESRTA
ncbi:hypothetical protein B2J96_06355 [Mycobacterium shigaense]|nr:hypothetical protein B2J96_06355 [Mycobacterium shigaense]